jgi:hypothetical protein
MKREGEAGKSGFSFREWLLAGVAIAGLAITGVTTYLSTFRKEDDVRILETRSPGILHRAGSPTVIIVYGSDWTFANTGNRQAVINGGLISLVRDKGDDDCSSDPIIVENLSISAFVLEPQKVETRPVKILRPDPATKEYKPTSMVELPMIGQFAPHERTNVKLCYTVFANTPEQEIRSQNVVHRFQWKFDEDYNNEYMLIQYVSREPWLVVHKTAFKFF